MIRTLSRDEVADILFGACLFGAGGGGDLQEGFDLLDLAVRQGKTFRLAALDDVEDDALLCTPYLLGAVSDLPSGEAVIVGGETHPVLLAVQKLEQTLGRRIQGALPCELGGSNTAVPFFVAAMMDAVVIDADPAGRAVPEITHSTYALAGLPASPIFAANAAGETMVLDNIGTDQRAEELVRALAKASQNDIAAVDHACPARDLRGNVLIGTLSEAERLGRLWREGRSDPASLPAIIANAAGGAVVFQGVVTSSTDRAEDGFTFGQFEIDGTGAFAGQHLCVEIKNENMIARKDGAILATIPEIISVLDTDTGEIVTNPHTYVGQNLAVLILPAPEIFTTRDGLACFGPSYLGLDTAFKSALLADH